MYINRTKILGSPISKKAAEISVQYYENLTSKKWIEAEEAN